MPENKRDYLMELWYNRPWKYIPAVISYMRDYSPKKLKARGGRFSYRVWLRNCLYVNWQVAFKRDSSKPVYHKCNKCLCHACADKKCAAQNCALCDKLFKHLGGSDHCVTITCGRARKIREEADV